MKNLILATLVLTFSLASFADEKDGARVSLAVLKYDFSNEGPTLGNSDTSFLMYDLKVGYLTNNLYFGAIYDSKNTTVNSASDKRTAYGATIGYHNNGWFIDGSYFLSAERSLAGTNLKDGKGFGVDLGYIAMVGSNFFFGLQASYKSITYEKVEAVEQTNKEKSELYPLIILGVAF